MSTSPSKTLDKAAIKSMVLFLRRTLEDDYTVVLRRFGLYTDRNWLEKDQPHRERMVAAMQPEIARIKAAGTNDTRQAEQEATRWYIREAAFTMLNRLVGLKCLEVRGLFPEVIQTRVEYGGRSEYHRNWRADHLEAASGSDDGLPAMLVAACREVTSQIGTLFDPDSDNSIVLPRYATLKEAIARINALPEDHWCEDEIIGWIYQFYNAEEKESIRKRGKPRLPIEVAVINQFFTPRWIVKFLVDNTLGRLWLEMHPDSPRVRNKCDYLVPEVLGTEESSESNEDKQVVLDPDSPINHPHAPPRRDAKLPQELKLIDPACGAMHFGHYAFEVFTAIYQDTREQGYVDQALALDDMDIPLAILHHNLYGVDIDLRAVQLAALALYLKARTALRDQGVSNETATAQSWQVNLVSADARLPANGMREDFLRDYEDDKSLQRVWRELFIEMEDIAQVGSLLRVEQRFKALLEQQKPPTVDLEGTTSPQLSFDNSPEATWNEPRRSLETMLGHLRAFARDALETADVNAQLFAAEAEKTLGLLDILMQDYDVVVMNPPYGDTLDDARKYLARMFPKTKKDLYAAFIERAFQMIKKLKGYSGGLTHRSYLYLTSFTKLRDILIHKNNIPTMLDLGWGILDGAAVETVASVNSPNIKDLLTIFINVVDKRDDRQSVFENNLHEMWHGRQPITISLARLDSFSTIPDAPFAYWSSTSLKLYFKNFPTFDPNYADVRQGMTTANDQLFLRTWWEIGLDQIGIDRRWCYFAKGGEFSRYYSNIDLIVDWNGNGNKIKKYVCERYPYLNDKYDWVVKNEAFFFREGATWPRISMKGFGVRYLPKDHIFADKGPLISFHNSNLLWYGIGWINSSLVQIFLFMLTPSRSFEISHIKALPFCEPSKPIQQTVATRAKEIHDIKAIWDTGNEICTRFDKPWLLKVAEESDTTNFDLLTALDMLEHQEAETDTQLQQLQHEIDEAVYHLYDISATDRVLIERELGTRPPELVWPQMEGKSKTEKRKEHVRRLFSFFLLNLLKNDPDGLIPLFSGTGEPTVIERLRSTLEENFGMAALALEDAAVQVLGRQLESWLEREYSKWHQQLYKRRPIVWHLASERGTFAILLYYHKLSADTLPKLRSSYVRRKIDTLGTALRRATERQERELVLELETQTDDLRVFDERLEQVINTGYSPMIDDGVKQNILPLQEAGLLRHKVV